MFCLALSALTVLSPTTYPSDGVAHWKGRKVDAEVLQASLGQGVLDVLLAWSPWAQSQGYEAYVEPLGRVVLYLAADARGVTR